MYRRFTDRILGGVCGGLGRATRLSPWLWRVLFVLLTLFTGGAGALVYLACWWVLPQDSLVEARGGGSVGGLLAILSAIVLLGGYFARDTLSTLAPNNADIYLPLAFVWLALIFLGKQLFAGRGAQRNMPWGLVALTGALALLLGVAGALPTGIYDLILRSWPAVLLFGGLLLLLRGRVPLGGTLAIIACGGLVAGLATFAYTSRIDTERSNYRYEYDETIPADTLLLQVNIETLATDITVISSPPDTNRVQAVFTGSSASTIPEPDTLTPAASGIATLSIREVRSDPFPALDQVGRGTLRLELPQKVALAVSFSGADGNASFDMDDMQLERLNLTLQAGDALVTLPAYQPLSPSVIENPGRLQVLDGDLRLVVPPPDAADGRFVIDQRTNQRPQIDDLTFFLEDAVNRWILQPRSPGFEVPQFQYLVDVPQGSIRVETQASPADAP